MSIGVHSMLVVSAQSMLWNIQCCFAYLSKINVDTFTK